MLRRLPALAGLAAFAGVGAEFLADRAFARLVRRDVQALHARASGVVTEQMLADLPDPVRRYLRYAGVVGKPFPGTSRLHQKSRMRADPGQRWVPWAPRSTTRCARPTLHGRTQGGCCRKSRG